MQKTSFLMYKMQASCGERCRRNLPLLPRANLQVDKRIFKIFLRKLLPRANLQVYKSMGHLFEKNQYITWTWSSPASFKPSLVPMELNFCRLITPCDVCTLPLRGERNIFDDKEITSRARLQNCKKWHDSISISGHVKQGLKCKHCRVNIHLTCGAKVTSSLCSFTLFPGNCRSSSALFLCGCW